MTTNHFRFLIDLNGEIGKHIIATDDKREKIVNLYFIIIIGAIAAVYRFLQSATATNANIDDFYLFSIFIFSSLIILGEIITFSMIGARKWHAQYMNCSMILQKIIVNGHSNICVDNSFIPRDLKEPFWGGLDTSRSFLITQFGIWVLFLNIGYYLFKLIDKGTLAFVIILILSKYSTLIIIANRAFALSQLDKHEIQFWRDPLKTWCLTGLKFLTNQKDDSHE